MAAEGGILSLWRGNGVSVMRNIPEAALKYGLFEALKNKFCDAEPTVGQRFLSGAVAGSVAQTCIYPMEVLKTRMVLRSSRQYSTVFGCIKTIYQQEGIKNEQNYWRKKVLAYKIFLV